MTIPSQCRSRVCLGSIAAFLAVLAACTASRYFDCLEEAVDIHSGRMRTTKRWLTFELDQQTSETWLSRAASAPLGPPLWRPVNTFSAGKHYSPHYRYHGAITQAQQLELLEERIPFDKAARVRIADQILQDWQSGSCVPANQSITKLEHIVATLHDRNAAQLTAEDLQ